MKFFGNKLLWGEEPIEHICKTRDQICLNGIWKFMPGNNVSQVPSDTGWGLIRVPGAWHNPIPWEQWEGILEKSDGEQWEYKNTQEIKYAWYSRKVTVPALWSGRAILLELRRITANGIIFVNGCFCGRIDIYTDVFDLTGFITPGVEAELTIQVMGGYGISGDVYLVSRPSGAYISDVFVKTSTRLKVFALDVEVCGLTNSGELKITARILDEKGSQERLFCSSVSGIEKHIQTLSLEWKWENPTLWDIGEPNLYSLILEVKGLDVDDEYVQVFGFREFWIEGRCFFLNGTQIRLRPVMAGTDNNLEVIDGALESYVWAGYNIAELWPRDVSLEHCELWYEQADKKGFALTAPVGHMWEFMKDWENPETRIKYEKIVAMTMKRVRNHPSVLMWGTNANQFGSSLGMDPRNLGIKKDPWYDVAYWRRRRVPIGEEGLGIIRKYDASRPVFTHHGGGVGDVYTLNMYLNIIPLQEREEWLSNWVKHGELPIMIVEFGTPLHVTFMRGRCDFPEAIHTEPWQTEFSAIYFGKKAYEMETEEYRKAIKDKFIGGQEYSSWHYIDTFDFSPNMQAIQHLFSKNTWRSWRTMGITGGMIPWHNGHGWGTSPVSSGEHSEEVIKMGPFTPGTKGTYLPKIKKGEMFKLEPKGNTIYPGGQAIIENNSATLAWIAGPSDEFTSKKHSYFSGSTVKKQIVLINDTRGKQSYSYTWRAWQGGEVIDIGKDTGEVSTAETLFIPLEFTVQSSKYTDKQSGTITLEAEIGGHSHADSFEFRVFPRHRSSDREIYIYDPIGKTRMHLDNLGFKIREWNGESDAELVIIGSCVMSQGYTLPESLEKYTHNGGKVIIFAQEPQWLRDNLGFRVSHHVSRRVFAISNEHPVVEGLDEEDLRDWAGGGSLIDAYPDFNPGEAKLGKWWFPYHGYHWGNRGSVSSAAIEKPHFSSWRSILECEFDLAYTPLMELDYGKGRVVFCTLDVEGREAKEPVAAMISRQLIEYLEEASLKKKVNNVTFIGNDDEEALLCEMGLVFDREENLSGKEELLILGSEGALSDHELLVYLKNGGRVFCLAGKQENHRLGVKLKKTESMHGSINVPKWCQCEGLSSSDLRGRTSNPAWLLEGGCSIGADGLLGKLEVENGILFFCQLDPEQLNADEYTYFRFTRWRQMRAIAQVLANMGASFKTDKRIFNPVKNEQIALEGLWNVTVVRPDENVEFDSCVGGDVQGAYRSEIMLPCVWKELKPELQNIKDELIFSKIIYIPKAWEGSDLTVCLGKLDASDKTYFNGVLISESDIRPQEPHNYPRVYIVPKEFVKPEKNIITVHIYHRENIFDSVGDGGFYGPKTEMYICRKLGRGDVSFYHTDYRADYVYGDDPYRYFNW